MLAAAFRARKNAVSIDDVIENKLNDPDNQRKGAVTVHLTSIEPISLTVLKRRLETRGFTVEVSHIVENDYLITIS